MSKITLAPNAAGSGTYTIAAPNSNNSRTMGLPDSAGDLVVTQAAQTLTNKTFSGAQVFGTASLDQPTGNAPLYAARAWVNFNGTGTVAIRASGNVSSITDNGVGDYTVNFTAAMPDANYSALVTNQTTFFGGNAFSTTCAISEVAGSLSSTSLRVVHIPAGDVSSYSGAVNDTAVMCVSIFR